MNKIANLNIYIGIKEEYYGALNQNINELVTKTFQNDIFFNENKLF